MGYRLKDIVDLAVRGGYAALDRKYVGYDDQPYVEYPDDAAYYECGHDEDDRPFIAHIDSSKGFFPVNKPVSNLDMILARVKAKKVSKGLYGWSDSYVDKSHYNHFDTSDVPPFTNVDIYTDDDPDY